MMGTLQLAEITGQNTIDTTGQYLPSNRSVHDISNEGIMQAQLLNLKSFEHAGLIDMSANQKAGDVLLISGGTALGSDGGGQFVSNGGTIQMDTLLNRGGSISTSDILVIDNAVMGTGATKLDINPVAGSIGELTVGEGIQVVEVQNDQGTGVFTLNNALTYGQYEYILTQGSQGYYLQNKFTGSSGIVVPFLNPNIGSYLGNQHAAAQMFNQNILDRRDNVRSPDQTLWVRVNHNEVNTDLLGGKQHAEININLIQMGADFYKNGGIVLGVYAGYGESDIRNQSKQTYTTADGKVKGYHIGAYGSWMLEENKGPYVDVWGLYGWYQNQLGGMAQQYQSAKYDSTGYSLSVEVGHGFELSNKNHTAWILEPHAQLTYTDLSADSFFDKNGTYYSSNKAEGLQTRLGARFYGHRSDESKGVLPFIEANWLHNGSSNRIRLNTQNNSSRIGEDVGEVKIGLQGNVSDKMSLSGHLGGQKGRHGYERYELQVGLNYNW